MGMKNFDNQLKEALHLSPRQVPLSWSRASMPTAQLVGRHHHYLLRSNSMFEWAKTNWPFNAFQMPNLSYKCRFQAKWKALLRMRSGERKLPPERICVSSTFRWFESKFDSFRILFTDTAPSPTSPSLSAEIAAAILTASFHINNYQLSWTGCC